VTVLVSSDHPCGGCGQVHGGRARRSPVQRRAEAWRRRQHRDTEAGWRQRVRDFRPRYVTGPCVPPSFTVEELAGLLRLVATAEQPALGATNGDIRCPSDGEWVNVRCWRCGWVRET
jgi:hypothetical protein